MLLCLWPVSAGTTPIGAPVPPPKPVLEATHVSLGVMDKNLVPAVKPDLSHSAIATTPWQVGLQSWLQGDYEDAHKFFAEIAKSDKTTNKWVRSGAAFWAARSADRMGERRVRDGYLQLAAKYPQTFYGQLALRVMKKDAPEIRNLPRLSQAAHAEVTVDEALVHAIIMQESRFSRTAKSRSGARGLMQLMPATARHIAGRNYQGDEKLYDEAYNVRLGNQYIQELTQQSYVGREPVLILAAYNSGPGALARWLSKAPAEVKSDPFMMIESYPFGQTRVYIEKVMANMWAYDWVLKKRRSSTLERLAKAF